MLTSGLVPDMGILFAIAVGSAYDGAMITVLIETRNDEIGLAHTLAALVPAAAEGAVREVIVLDRGSQDGTLVVADAAGCTIVEARADEAGSRRLAVERAKGDWLLILTVGTVLPPGWQGDAMAFFDQAMVGGRALTASARIERGRLTTGWRARLSGLWRLVAGGRREGGLLMSKAAWLSANAPSPAFAASSVSGARRGAA